MGVPNRKPGDAADSWLSEKESAFLYGTIAAHERSPRLNELAIALAERAEAQARLWADEAARRGEALPGFKPSARVSLVARLVGWLGVRPLMPVLSAMKVRGLAAYRAPAIGHAWPTAVGPEPGRHQGLASGGNLRAAVFGVNDGLVSNASLIFGVAGAAVEPRYILLTGFAGLLAGAFAMAAGEYVSVASQREFFERQINLEREEFALYPAEEAEELALVYAARGVPIEEARKLTARLVADPESAMDTLAREELGLNPHELGSPWAAAISSFLAFVLGAVLPLVPFLFLAGGRAIVAAAALSALGLFGVGGALSLFTGRNALVSGLRMVAIGGLAAGATYLIGTLIGVRLD
jgi:VIT1/CCC1 family predicted Fe2+/Mn2+ transporter